jgi:hypothetical protein
MSANITIDGTKLNSSQSTILRVAITSYRSDISINGLGDDIIGKRIKELTIDRLDEILELILGK